MAKKEPEHNHRWGGSIHERHFHAIQPHLLLLSLFYSLSLLDSVVKHTHHLGEKVLCQSHRLHYTGVASADLSKYIEYCTWAACIAWSAQIDNLKSIIRRKAWNEARPGCVDKAVGMDDGAAIMPDLGNWYGEKWGNIIVSMKWALGVICVREYWSYWSQLVWFSTAW